MSVMHELEKRADQHRVEALKKIDAVEQEHGDGISFAAEGHKGLVDEASKEVGSDSVEADKLTRDWHQNAS
jgi:hypothetical protein